MRVTVVLVSALIAIHPAALCESTWSISRISGLNYNQQQIADNRVGTVEIRCYLDQGGRVADLKAISGPADLVEMAAANAREWVFQRTAGNGNARCKGNECTLVYEFKVYEVSRRNVHPYFQFTLPDRIVVVGERIIPLRVEAN